MNILKSFRRLLFQLNQKKKPHCDICPVLNDPIKGCDRFKNETDEKDWQHGLYPESCLFW